VAPFTIAISLKMYFGHARTIAWCDKVEPSAFTSSLVRRVSAVHSPWREPH
jgi:hypothetical protein